MKLKANSVYDKELRRYYSRVLKDFGHILTFYIGMTTSIEGEIEKVIATFYLYEESEKDLLINYLLVDVSVNKKIQILKNLLQQRKFKHLFTKDIEQHFDKLLTIIKKRNRIAHSIPILEKPIENKKISRIAFKNTAHSTSQNLFISKKEKEADSKALFDIQLYIWTIKSDVEMIKYKDKVIARSVHQAFEKFK